MDASIPFLERIASALERLAPPSPAAPDWRECEAFVWDGRHATLIPVASVSAVDLDLLKGIGPQKAALMENTRRFAAGRPANHALLWGARGMGKTALIKAVFRHYASALALVEIRRDDLDTLPALLGALRASPKPVLLFCDDLSFDSGETAYKALKSILDGGLLGASGKTLFYATSNRRHLLARSMTENEQALAIHTSEAAEEHLSLSDRFGLWLGFYGCDQQAYLEMVRAYAAHFGIGMETSELERRALEWSLGRGRRSGRVAWQYIQSLR